MPATRLLNTIAQRVVDLQTDKRLAFPPITRDFTVEEVGNLLTTLLGEESPVARIRDLERDLETANERVEDLGREVEALKEDLNSAEFELSRERNR